MDNTFGYILVCQSPALFLAAIAFLICYLTRKRSRHVVAVLDLILAVVCVALGIALYYMGMLHDHFDIHNFWQIRPCGWVGLIIVAALMIYVLYCNFKRMSARRKAEKEANRAENARQLELERIKAEAYEAGKADAQAATNPPLLLTPAEPEVTPTSGELQL